MTAAADDTAETAAASAKGLDFGLLPGLLGWQLRRAQVALFQDFQAQVGGGRVTPGQFGVLALVDANPGLHQSALARALGIDRSTLVAVLHRLQARGWLARAPSPRDRRAHALHLTDAGRRAVARFRADVAAHEARFAATLGAAERETLLSLLARLNDVADIC